MQAGATWRRCDEGGVEENWTSPRILVSFSMLEGFREMILQPGNCVEEQKEACPSLSPSVVSSPPVNGSRGHRLVERVRHY